MEDEKRLYPMRFCELRDDYCWGSESFGVADLGYRDSLVAEGWLGGNLLGEIMDTYIDRVVGDDVYEWYGRQFPVCVRTVRCRGRMPLRVHPDDETAAQRFDLLGKEKFWMVLRCAPSAKVCIGFKEDCDATSLWQGCIDGSVEQMLNVIAPHAGQYFHIAPGTPHTLLGDIDVLEVSESSSADICLCSWGQSLGAEEFDETMTIADALDFISYRAWKSDAFPSSRRDGRVTELLNIPQMKICRLDLTDPLHISGEGSVSFALYCCAAGSASVQVDVCGRKACFGFKAGECLLVPAECNDFCLVPVDRQTEVLEVSMPARSERDAYINPNATERLEDE